MWKSHPKDLEVRSRKELKAIGLVGGVVDAFLDHPYYSVSDRTRIVADLVALEGVADRRQRSGDLLLFLAVDHAAWTETLDLLVGGVEREARKNGFEDAIVLVLAGDLTERARREIEDVGWIVETWTLDRLADLRREDVSTVSQ